jgi:hypothetical protein
MFLRDSRHKRASGEEVVYLQFVESVWNAEKGRCETRVIYNFGRADDPAVREQLQKLARSVMRRVSPEELEASGPGFKVIDSWPMGDAWVLEQLWRKVGLADLLPRLAEDAARLTLPVERAAFAMVANRCCAPASKLYLFEQWLREDVRIEGAEALELHQLYRAMDFFEKNKATIEKELFFRVADLFNCDVELVFYDTTTLHCEIDQEDAGGAADAKLQGSQLAGAKTYEALRQRGKSKNKRGDVPQVIVGMAMTRDGLPIRSWLFRGDTVDVKTVAQVKEDLKGWKLTRSVFVGDAGMVSKENLTALARGGGKYIVCMPMRRGDEITELVLGHPGRFRKVSENLHVKEVWSGEGERRRRYVICHNPAEEERQRQHRKQILVELQAMLESLHAGADGHSKRVCQLRASERYGRYVSITKGKPSVNWEKVKREERLDGKFVAHSNDDSLAAEDLALGYKQLASVENAWRMLKSGMRIRPMFHWAPHRISAHVSLTMIALLLERIAERACDDTWRNIRDDLRQIKLIQLLTPNGTVWQTTEPGPAARKRLKAIGLSPPPAVLKVAPTPTHTPDSE